VRLQLELALLPEAHDDEHPEGWTRGHVVALLRAAGYRVQVVRTPQPAPHPGDDEDGWARGLGPGIVAALAEARSAFAEVEPGPDHVCPMADCGVDVPDADWLEHLAGHGLAPCEFCGVPYRPKGLPRHRTACHLRPMVRLRRPTVAEAEAERPLYGPPLPLLEREPTAAELAGVPPWVRRLGPKVVERIDVRQLHGPPDPPEPRPMVPRASRDLLKPDPTAAPSPPPVAAPIERRPFDPDEVRRRAARGL
jgi:hypothetical protein